MKRFELKKKDWLDSSVFRISLVENPAIETDFIFLSKQDQPIQLSVQAEKRMIYSPVLIPDKVIPRVTDSGEEYEIFFSGDTIEEIAKDYMLKKVTLGEWNSEHNENDKLDGVDVIENWIVENPSNDKANALGFKVPAKTWMQGTYIGNDEVWSDIKSGKYKGVSVEADMNHELINLKADKMKGKNVLLDRILGRDKAPQITKLASMEVSDGVSIYADSFEEGAKVYIDEAMTTPANGSYEVNGKTYTVEGGVLVSMTDVPVEAEVEAAVESVVESLGKVTEAEVEEVAEEVVSEIAEVTSEEVSEEAVEDVKSIIDDLMSKVAESSKATESMRKENEDLRSALKDVKENLSSIKEAIELNKIALSKFQPKSIQLTATSNNHVANYLNNRKSY